MGSVFWFCLNVDEHRVPSCNSLTEKGGLVLAEHTRQAYLNLDMNRALSVEIKTAIVARVAENLARRPLRLKLGNPFDPLALPFFSNKRDNGDVAGSHSVITNGHVSRQFGSKPPAI